MLTWGDNGILLIHKDHTGFAPEHDKLNEMIQLTEGQINSLNNEQRLYYEKSLKWVLLGKLLLDQKKKIDNINQSNKKK